MTDRTNSQIRQSLSSANRYIGQAIAKTNFDLLFVISLLLLTLLFLMKTFDYTGDDTVFPFAVLTPTITVLSIIIVVQLKNDGLLTDDISGNSLTENKFIYTSSWIISFFVITYFLGFFISIPVFSIFFLITYNKSSWLMAIVQTLGILLFIWLVFGHILDTPIYGGIL